MPNVYPPNSRVPELNGVASGGVTIVLHRPEEVDLLYAFISVAPHPPASPLKSLAAALADPRLDLAGWHREWIATKTNFVPSSASEQDLQVSSNEVVSDVELSDLSALRNVLLVLKTVWNAEPDDIPLLSCVVTVGSDTDGGKDEVSWDTATPNLTFGRGSLDIWLGTSTRRAGRFLAGLVLGGGIDATARAPHLVQRARTRAVASLDRLRPLGVSGPEYANLLPPLSELEPKQVKGVLVVLIHGLCSTDVGTFGDFEKRLRSIRGVTVAGFPHDSLTTPIRLNARELAQYIVRLGKHHVRLVCHSRGGLVARQAYMILKNESVPKGKKWLHSCVTFGTPHRGTSIASSPETLTGLIMAAAHVRRAPGSASLVDVLCGASSKGFVGVSELMPSSEPGSFLSELEKQENRLFLDDELNLTAFGSVVGGATIWNRIGRSIVGRMLGTSDHDLLVPTSSSIPMLRASQSLRLVNRSHFEYFTRLGGEAADPPHFDQAIAPMQLEDAIR